MDSITRNITTLPNPDSFSKRCSWISFNVTPLPVPVVSCLLTCTENECSFMNFVAQSISEGDLMCRGSARLLSRTYKPDFLLKVIFLRTIIIVICRCYLFRRSISSSKKQVKSIFVQRQFFKIRRSTEAFSFVTSIIGKTWRKTSMSSSLCNSGS